MQRGSDKQSIKSRTTLFLQKSDNFTRTSTKRNIFKMNSSPVGGFCSDPSRTAYGHQILEQILQDSQQQSIDPVSRNKNNSGKFKDGRIAKLGQRD